MPGGGDGIGGGGEGGGGDDTVPGGGDGIVGGGEGGGGEDDTSTPVSKCGVITFPTFPFTTKVSVSTSGTVAPLLV